MPRIQPYDSNRGKLLQGHHLSLTFSTQEHRRVGLLSGRWVLGGEGCWWGNHNLPSSGPHPRPLGAKRLPSPYSLSSRGAPGPGPEPQALTSIRRAVGDTQGRNNRAVAAAVPLPVAAVEVNEIAVLDALGAGQPPAGSVAQRTPLDSHVQPLGVVHRVHQVPSERPGPAARSLRRPGSLPTGRRHDGLRAEPVTWDFVFNQVHPGRGGGAWGGAESAGGVRRAPCPASPSSRPGGRVALLLFLSAEGEACPKRG